jgi:DNA-binding response OmpR family regulator
MPKCTSCNVLAGAIDNERKRLAQSAFVAERDSRIPVQVHAFIIEDDYLISQSLQDMLERLGYDRFSFARSEDAAVLGADRHIDLITADVRLLPGDGLDAVRAICATRRIPVVFVTGYADELIDRDPDAVVIQKPVNEDELRAAIREAEENGGERC